MQCREFENLLSEYLDGAAPPIEQAMGEHRASCSACEQLYRQVSELVDDMNRLPHANVPETLVRSILSETSGARKPRDWRSALRLRAPAFLSPRFVMVTGMMFVLFSLTVNVLGPNFAALGDSSLSAASLRRGTESVVFWAYKRWLQINATQNQMVAEVRLLKGDLTSRIDHSVLSILFTRYDDVVQEPEPDKAPEKQPERKEEKADPGKKPGAEHRIIQRDQFQANQTIGDWGIQRDQYQANQTIGDWGLGIGDSIVDCGLGIAE
ncbi:MAG: anti-sigma factor family protein [Acidobacteriota bacterium]